MTVPTEDSFQEYPGNGVTTSFPTDFVFQDSSQITVLYTPSGGTQTTWVEGSDYTVTGGDGAEGTVEATVAPASGDTLRIERNVQFVQAVDFSTFGDFAPDVHEEALDHVTYGLQELNRRVSALESAPAVTGTVEAGDGLQFSGAVLSVHVSDPTTGLTVGGDAGVAVNFDASAPPACSAAAGTVGTADGDVARGSHTHQITTGSVAALVAGGAGSNGSGNPLALANHVHAVPTGTPVNVTKSAAAAGSSGNFADAAHKHDVSTAAAVSLTDSSNAEGSATTLARSDHTHSHGDRGGGTLHAEASTNAAGFMSAADKVKLDAMAADVVSTHTTVTTDAVATKLAEWTQDSPSTEVVEVMIAGKKSGAAEGVAYTLSAGFRRHDGTAAQIGATLAGLTVEDAGISGCAVSISVVASPAVTVLVTGVAATTINWAARVVRRKASP